MKHGEAGSDLLYEAQRGCKKVIVSGSLQNDETLHSLQNSLSPQGVELFCEPLVRLKEFNMAAEHARLIERFAEIADAACEAVIIAELTPHTLMDIAVAVAYHKPFYFFGSLPSVGSYGYEEVACLRPVALNGSFAALADKLCHPECSYQTDLNNTIPDAPGSIALFCSMKFRAHAVEIQAELVRQNIPAYIPAIETHETAALTEQDFANFKLRVMRTYFERIKHPHTQAALTLNYPKHGIDGYIGPNTLMEMAVAMAAGKPNYLLYDLPALEVVGAQAVRSLNPQSLHGILKIR